MTDRTRISAAIVPVAGLGTRLLPATRSQPKEMLPVLGTPVVQYVVEELAAAGVARLLFVTGRRKRAIEDHFDFDPELERAGARGSGPAGELAILYTRQPRPAGLGDALARGAAFAAGAPVVVALGDSIIEPAPHQSPGSLITRLGRAFAEHDACAAIAVAPVADELVGRYGIVEPAAQADTTAPFPIAGIREKPTALQTTSRWAVMGRYVLASRVLDELGRTEADASGEIQLADALRTLLAEGGRVVGVPLDPGERRHDIGTVAGYASVFVRYALRDPELGGELRRQAAALLHEHA